MKISVDNYDVFERVQNITKVDYEIIWKDAENIEGYIDENTILGMMEDLILEVDRLKEELEEEKWKQA